MVAARLARTAGSHRAVWLLGQALIVLGATAAYFGVRGLTEGRPELALRNADRLMEVQRTGAALAAAAWIVVSRLAQRETAPIGAGRPASGLEPSRAPLSRDRAQAGAPLGPRS